LETARPLETASDLSTDISDAKYGVKFPIMAKIEVNGPNTSPVYAFIKSQKPGDIKWNFEKALIDGQGNVVERFGSGTTPAQLEAIIGAKL